MKLSNLNKVPKDKWKMIKPSFAISSLIASIPMLMGSLGSIVGLFKASFSISGEIKDKLTAYKWDNTKKVQEDASFNIF
ncbi:hypothetical protein [Mycoplasmopsis edwardii]|uniref:Uncharacterized protein n=1 Tax=Mycoplasmopsis edwardii TaxID=53558 RepID=A0ACD4PJB6_9BACT|nr:hypothetical protein [Mycoplasmopsis edwardii]WBP84218.1 hypothetical protein Me_995_000191 [Mycoplasmopsis edwardii]